MTLSEKFAAIISVKDVQTQIDMIEALDGQEAKDILKAYVEFIGRPSVTI